MSTQQSHLSLETLALYTDDALPATTMRGTAAHVETCVACRTTAQSFSDITDLLRSPVPGEAIPLNTERGALEEAPPEPRTFVSRWARPFPAAASAAVLLLLAVGGALFLNTDAGTSLPLGVRTAAVTDTSRWTGIHAFRTNGRRGTTPLDTTVAPIFARDDALVFSYINGSSEPFDYLMVFGVDAEGVVHWYYPAFEDAAEAPPSIAIDVTQAPLALPDAVQHDVSSGPFTLHAVFSRRPLYTKDVESEIAAGMNLRDLDSDAVEQVITLTVQ